jgi:ribonuclease HI
VDVYLKVSVRGEVGAWAALLRSGDQERIVSKHLEGVSANRALIVAAIQILEKIPASWSITLHCAAEYLIHGATQWVPAWRRQRWRTKEGKEVAHFDDWKRLDELSKARPVEWVQLVSKDLPRRKDLEAALRG